MFVFGLFFFTLLFFFFFSILLKKWRSIRKTNIFHAFWLNISNIYQKFSSNKADGSNADGEQQKDWMQVVQNF